MAWYNHAYVNADSTDSCFMIFRSLTARIAATLGCTFFLAGFGFGYIHHRQGEMGLQALLLKQAQAVFRQVQEMRHWNAGYGGVYVLKTPGMETNKYLYKVGPKKGVKADIHPEITDVDGRTYTLKNPALMTRELSEIVRQETDIRFHLTSLKLINPDNRPSEFEKLALNRFEAGASEWHEIADTERGRIFRYMAPLKVEKACLKCHGFQGYREGDIRGGISVELPMDSADSVAEHDRVISIVGGFSLLSVLILILWFALRAQVLRPIRRLEQFSHSIGSSKEVDTDGLPARQDEIGDLYRTLAVAKETVEQHQRQLESMAGALDEDRRHDPLTGLHNRRHLYLEGPQLFDMANRHDYEVSSLMVDLDHFKEVNDTYGHATGDKVLVEVAGKLMEHSRSYDLLIRYGGEEFALIILNCDREQSLQIADRIRQEIGEMAILSEAGEEITITCSIGVATGRHNEMEQMLLRSDEAMYMAKEGGRDEVRHIDLSLDKG